MEVKEFSLYDADTCLREGEKEEKRMLMEGHSNISVTREENYWRT